MPNILDACAIIAYLRDENGADELENHFLDDESFVHSVNLCEVFYDFIKFADENESLKAVRDVLRLGIKVRDDIDFDFWQEVGRLKAYNKLSLADCFALALTKRLNGVLITSDRKEFEPIKAKDIANIKFFR